jgi:heme a synthase
MVKLATPSRSEDNSQQRLVKSSPYAASEHSASATAGYRRSVFGLALALAVSVFPLIWVGGLVTTYDAGMAVPDWPNTYGWNMWAYPLETWMYGPFNLMAEHSHRLLGTVAGFLSIGLVIAAWMTESRRWFRWWTVAVLLAVIAQGALGGMRVLLDARTLAMIHGCTGPLFFAMATATAVMASRFWHIAARGAALSPPTSGTSASAAGSPPLWQTSTLTRKLATAMAVLSFLQLTVGAQLRHITGDTSGQYFMGAVHLHLTLAVMLVVLALSLLAATPRSAAPLTRLAANVLGLLVLVQIALGTGTWVVNYALPWSELNETVARYTILAKGYWESMVVTAHVATGSLIICVSTVAAVGAWRQPVAAKAHRREVKGLWKKQLA